MEMHLQKTNIGKLVTKVKKNGKGEVCETAAKLVKKWKAAVATKQKSSPMGTSKKNMLKSRIANMKPVTVTGKKAPATKPSPKLRVLSPKVKATKKKKVTGPVLTDSDKYPPVSKARSGIRRLFHQVLVRKYKPASGEVNCYNSSVA